MPVVWQLRDLRRVEAAEGVIVAASIGWSNPYNERLFGTQATHRASQ